VFAPDGTTEPSMRKTITIGLAAVADGIEMLTCSPKKT